MKWLYANYRSLHYACEKDGLIKWCSWESSKRSKYRNQNISLHTRIQLLVSAWLWKAMWHLYWGWLSKECPRNGGTVWTVSIYQKGVTQEVNRKPLLPACEGFQPRFPLRTLTKLNYLLLDEIWQAHSTVKYCFRLHSWDSDQDTEFLLLVFLRSRLDIHRQC